MNNKEFWDNQAKEYKKDVKAVNFDPLEEVIENNFLSGFFSKGDVVCDLGCGNGRTTLFLAERFPDVKFVGIDFIDEMINNAKIEQERLGLKNIDFYVYDASDLNLINIFKFKFNKIYTKRLLINLKGDLKYNAIKNILNLLDSNGIYLMIECFEEPLKRINEIRKIFSLEEIKVKFFNEYLSENFLSNISSDLIIEDEHDIESLYYFISRVFNAKMSNGNPDYHSEINKISVEITKNININIKGYSPQRYIILKRKK